MTDTSNRNALVCRRNASPLCTNVNFIQVLCDVRDERDERDERDAQLHLKKYINALKRANDCTDVDPCDTARNDTCVDCTAATTATTATTVTTVTTSESVDIPKPKHTLD